MVCQELEKTDKWKALKRVQSFPPGLNNLYLRIMQQISKSEDKEICEQILALVATTYQPSSILELTTFIDECREMPDNYEYLGIVI